MLTDINTPIRNTDCVLRAGTVITSDTQPVSHRSGKQLHLNVLKVSLTFGTATCQFRGLRGHTDGLPKLGSPTKPVGNSWSYIPSPADCYVWFDSSVEKEEGRGSKADTSKALWQWAVCWETVRLPNLTVFLWRHDLHVTTACICDLKNILR